MSFIDRWIPTGIEDYSLIYTPWYASRFPKTTSFARENFTHILDKAVQNKLCRDEKLGAQDMSTFAIDGYGSAERQRVGSVTEKLFGDPEQNENSATLFLGNYTVGTDSFNACIGKCGGPPGCAKPYRWSARIVVVDGLGVHPSNFGIGDTATNLQMIEYAIGLYTLGGERTAIIAAWNISGSGCCPK